MKFLATYCLCFIVLVSLDLSVIRTAYKGAAQNAKEVDAFYESLANVSKQDRPELVAYKGASIALKAKKSKTLKAKKDGFIEGVEWVEFAIEQAPNNVEARFIRLSIQENTPKLLKYKSNIEEDKGFILKQFNNIASTSLKNYIKDYILHSKVFTDEEKSLI